MTDLVKTNKQLLAWMSVLTLISGLFGGGISGQLTGMSLAELQDVIDTRIEVRSAEVKKAEAEAEAIAAELEAARSAAMEARIMKAIAEARASTVEQVLSVQMRTRDRVYRHEMVDWILHFVRWLESSLEGHGLVLPRDHPTLPMLPEAPDDLK
ncbi:MAG: hypothetical protein AAGE65_14735 [Planctomycetota bacterium]